MDRGAWVHGRWAMADRVADKAGEGVPPAGKCLEEYMMIRKQKLTGVWPLGPLWVVANLVGWAAGVGAGSLLIRVAGAIPGVNEDRVAMYILLLSTGLLTGISQWGVM